MLLFAKLAREHRNITPPTMGTTWGFSTTDMGGAQCPNTLQCTMLLDVLVGRITVRVHLNKRGNQGNAPRAATRQVVGLGV